MHSDANTRKRKRSSEVTETLKLKKTKKSPDAAGKAVKLNAMEEQVKII